MGNRQNKLNETTEVSPGLAQTGRSVSLPASHFPSNVLHKSVDSFARIFPRLSKRRIHKSESVSGLLEDTKDKPDGYPIHGVDGDHTGKDHWPVPLVEALFLPEFTIKAEAELLDFEVLDVIGSGAFGNVLKVRFEDDKKVYAMKVLRKAQVIIEGDVQQCKDEISIQKMLGHHAFIVTLHQYWQSKKSLYIVMDYACKGDLFSLWKHMGSFSVELTRLYIGQIALALDFLNKAGVIYRDLKLENVLLDVDGHVQLTDFGLSKWLKRGQRTQTICGTLQYMAPEVLLTKPYSHSADWWTLGILMYALLQGQFPVQGAKDHNEMAEQVVECDYSLHGEYSIELKNVLKGLLHKDPSVRIQNLNQLQREPFFKNLNFESIQDKLYLPKDYIPDWQDYKSAGSGDLEISQVEFPNFEWTSPILYAEAVYV